MKRSLLLLGWLGVWAVGGALAGCAGGGKITAEDASAANAGSGLTTGPGQGRDTARGGRELTAAQQTVATAGDPAAPPDARRRAMAQIATSTAAGEAVYLEFYRAVLADPATDPTLASLCATALANHGRADDVSSILPLLGAAEAFTRWQAAVALQRLHHPDAVGPLMRTAADDDDADTRAAAARALGQYPRRDVFDTLVIALDDPDTGVSREAREALTRLTGQTAGEDPRAWLDLAAQRRSGGGSDAPPLFDPQPYTYLPYPPSRGWLGWVFFFLPPTQATPAVPTGMTP